MPATHFATRNAARSRRRIERVVGPFSKSLVVLEYSVWLGTYATEIVMWRIDLGGEWTRPKLALRRQYRKTADAPRAHPMVARLAIAFVWQFRAAPRVKQHLVALVQTSGMRGGPFL